MEHKFVIEEAIRGNYAHLYVWVVVYGVAFVAILFSCLTDLFYGLEAAKARKERIKSRGLRRTVKKVIPYLAIVLMGWLCDAMMSMLPLYNYPFLTTFIAICCVVIEARSVIENLKDIKSPAGHLSKEMEELAKKIDGDTLGKIIDLVVRK